MMNLSRPKLRKLKKWGQYIIDLAMTSEPTVSRRQRHGLSAEAEIEARLILFSEPAKPKPDKGIDFICKLSERVSAQSRLFGVQVKGTGHFKDCWYGSIKKSTVEGWLRLLFPVFLVVYDEDSGNCYWMSITHNLKSILEKMQKNNKAKTIRIKMDRSHILKKGENKNDDFIRTVKDAQNLISLILGRPEFSETYVRTKRMYILPKRTRANLKENIRNSLNHLIYHYLLTNDLKKAYFLCNFLTRFDKGHYDHFVLFAQLNRFYGMEEEALRNYDEAIRICKSDKKWNKRKAPSDQSIEEIIAIIEKERAKGSS